MGLIGSCEWCGEVGSLRFVPGPTEKERPTICERCRQRAEQRREEQRVRVKKGKGPDF